MIWKEDARHPPKFMGHGPWLVWRGAGGVSSQAEDLHESVEKALKTARVRVEELAACLEYAPSQDFLCQAGLR